jgi:hypothetical protein
MSFSARIETTIGVKPLQRQVCLLPVGFDTGTPRHLRPGQVCARCKCTLRQTRGYSTNIVFYNTISQSQRLMDVLID